MSTPGKIINVRAMTTVPTIAARVWLRLGAREEVNVGEAAITGRLLAEGTTHRSARRLSREAEARGMVLEGFGGYEAIGVAIDALARDTPRVLDDLAELVHEPAFPSARFEWLTRQAEAELRSQRDQPEVRTSRAFLEALYGRHPYGRPLAGSVETLAALRREDCPAFHARALDAGMVITLVGDLDEAQIESAIAERFDHPRSSDESPEPAFPISETPMPAPRAQRSVIDLPPGDQAHVVCGHLSVPRAHPDRPALDLIGVVLGAGTGVRGRLPDRVREREGLAYGLEVGVAAGAGRDRGRFVVYSSTAPARVGSLERAVREELERLLEDGPTAAEIEEARSYLVGSLPFTVETPRLVADRLAEAAFYGPRVAPDALERAWRDLDRHSVLDVARRHLDPDALTVVIGLPRGG